MEMLKWAVDGPDDAISPTAIGAHLNLRHAVLSLCKPPEPEKVEAWGIVNGEGRIAGLHELLTGAKESLAKLNRDGSLPPYSITYLSGIKGQGKPEENNG